MGLADLARDSHADISKPRDKLIGVYIGILAVILAICSMGGGNASNEAMFKNIEGSNTWAFFQAKNIRRHVLRLHIDEFEATIASIPSMPENAKSMIDGKLTAYRAQVEKLTSEKDTKEGLDELFAKGKSLEAERDTALKRGPYFDYGQALLQIAIVLASIAILAGGNLLIGLSAILGILGTISTFGGYTLSFALPF